VLAAGGGRVLQRPDRRDLAHSRHRRDADHRVHLGGVALLILESQEAAPGRLREHCRGFRFRTVAAERAGGVGPCGSGGVAADPASRLGLLIYAAGSDPVAAFRSGVNVRSARTIAYVFSGIACALGGMALTMTTGIGAPLAGPTTRSAALRRSSSAASASRAAAAAWSTRHAAILLTLAPMDLVFLGIDRFTGRSSRVR